MSGVVSDADSGGLTARRRLRVTGVVQGVGFRPFVHRLANEIGLCGFVGNDPTGVFVEAQGAPADLDDFARRLTRESPPLARVDTVEASEVEAEEDVDGFAIVESVDAGRPGTLIPPDVAVCDDCLAEVRDIGDRRYRYPFANCTNCGPRFTIIHNLPYDRRATTMAGFEMCEECEAEYSDPVDRRFHAEPIACPACGPQIAFDSGELGVRRETDPVLAAVQNVIASGGIVAIKGLGGYHLACDASNDAAIARLRDRKGRAEKPFALMVPDLAAARELAEVSSVEAEVLVSPARPIVLLRRRMGRRVSERVAPHNPLIGVMLPYTPLHHLLFVGVPGRAEVVPTALVFTSGNRSEEPICFDDAVARERLASIADAFCTHDRPIEFPCDDSVVRMVDGEVQPIRRSRGYAPLPVRLPVEVTATLAVGGDLKNTFCLAQGRSAWVSQHMGGMRNLDTLAALTAGVEGFVGMYDVAPRNLAVDSHPEYLTRRWAREWSPAGSAIEEVQHHHAHVAAVMAEHGLGRSEKVIGVAFDGTGYGTASDGSSQIWGGEILVAGYEGFERVGHLAPLPLPGGDGAVRNPCRIAVGYLRSIGGVDLDPSIPAVAACDEIELGVVIRLIDQSVGCVPTTSMGRLFDAAASLIGVRHRITYEGQAAIELEACAETGAGEAWPLAFEHDDAGVIDPDPVLRGLLDGMAAGARTEDLARSFHEAVARAILHSVRHAATVTGLTVAVLTGGVFQNALLTGRARSLLLNDGFAVLTNRMVPPNDGGLSLGQAAIAGLRRN